jgi:PTS system N-acetylglucosamine-specific IIC component
MTGFFPVMMFGLPAACLAMYRSALPERRKAVGGLLLSVALTSFLTGVTEPIEFLFLFLAPLLFLVHAVLTGLSMVIMDLLGVRLGFGFSAGLFDYVLNFGLATRPLMLIPVGAAYFLIYYFTFSWCIRRFNLATPGREPPAGVVAPAHIAVGERGQRFVAALGGPSNLKSVDACMTRLRLTLADSARIDEPALRALGAKGIVRPGGDALQVVLGPIADQVVEEIRAARTLSTPRADSVLAKTIVRALEPAGIRSVELRGSRLLIDLDRPLQLSGPDLDALGTRGWVLVDGGVQLIIGPDAEVVAEVLSARLR